MKKIKMKFEKLEKIITIYNCILIPLLLLLSYLKYSILLLIEYEFIFGILSIFNIIFITIAIDNKYYKFKPIDVFILLLSIFAILSTCFSKNPITSIIGATGRYEGLIMILGYYILFTAISIIKEEKYKKLIILIFLLSSISQLQEKLFTIKNMGLIGNNNLFATYTLLVYSLSTGLFIFTKSKFLKYIYLLFSTLFLQYLVYSVTGSVIIAFVLIYIAILIYLIIIGILKLLKKVDNTRLSSYMHLIIKTSICLLIIIMFYNFKYRFDENITNENKYALNDVEKVINANIDNSFGTERGFIWKETLKRVPKYWLHGVGIDCFKEAFTSPLITPRNKRTVDKAHNEYLQIMITEGIFSSIIYVIFLLYIFFSSIYNILKYKKLDNTIYIGLFLAFLGYAIQAFANIRDIEVAPYFFIITGLLTQRYKNQEKLN